MKSLRHLEIEKVVLTPEEIEEAILEGKRKKYNKERFKEYWDKKENEKKK